MSNQNAYKSKDTPMNQNHWGRKMSNYNTWLLAFVKPLNSCAWAKNDKSRFNDNLRELFRTWKSSVTVWSRKWSSLEAERRSITVFEMNPSAISSVWVSQNILYCQHEPINHRLDQRGATSPIRQRISRIYRRNMMTSAEESFSWSSNFS